MDERYIATVDLGTSKIALTVAKVEGRNVQVVYYDKLSSEGVRNTAVFNPKKASLVIEELISKAEGALGITISHVATGLPRYNVHQEIATGQINRTDPDSSITEEEIESLKSIAGDNYPVDDDRNEVIYGAVAQSFSTEDYFQQLESDIVGMTGRELTGNFKVFVGKKKNATDVDTAFSNVGGVSCWKFFLPDVTAKVVLSREDFENGVALVDIGAGATSLTIYENKILRHYACIPFGGNSITNDIKLECGISSELAENIKLGFGICMPDRLQSMAEKVLQINNPETGGHSRVTVKYLSEIITARMKEIIDAMLYEIQESGFADKLRNGIVITGGAAELTNCVNLFKEVSGYKVRRGYPKRGLFTCDGCPGITEAGATSSVGLLMAAASTSFVSGTSADAAQEATEVEQIQTIEEQIPENNIAPITGTDKLFSEEEMGTLKEAPKKPVRKVSEHVRWKKIKSILKKADEELGDLYEKTLKDE